MGGLNVTKIKTNPVTDKLRSGQPAVGSWLSLCSPAAAEAMARVPWNDTIWIQRTLDAGALGLVVPMVNTAQDAASVVGNMRYATKGQRSFGGSRVASYIDGDYRTWTDQNLAVIVMIETIEAVENAEAIMAVDGVVGCFIGPNDLALSMGLGPSDTGPGTVHEAAIQRVLAACKKTGKAAGKHCFTSAELNLRIKEGFQFLALLSDAGFMNMAAKSELGAIDFSGAPGASKDAKVALY